jgi:hypothetical protein
VPAWNDLLNEVNRLPDDAARSQWLRDNQTAALKRVGALRGNRHVLFYASAFLQKPQAPPYSLIITPEDLNGLMSVVYGMDWPKGLTLILHTPGGDPNAAATIVAYLRSKFSEIEVIVPTFAMSAGTMISLAADRIVMGRQSQLGPIDPQMSFAVRSVSARAIVDQFDAAKADILGNLALAHVWAPILPSLGPALLQEAKNALEYGESMVGGWLAKYMFADRPDREAEGCRVAKHFNDATIHKSHGRRIDRDEAKEQGVVIEDLEDDQDLQDATLTAYHLATISIEHSFVTKLIASDTDRSWLKQWTPPGVPVPVDPQGAAQQTPRGQSASRKKKRR